VPYTIEINQDNLAPDATICVDALGELKNGKKYTVDDVTAARFEVMQGVPLSEANFPVGVTVTKLDGDDKQPEGDDN
jgi:hypothetical protein